MSKYICNFKDEIVYLLTELVPLHQCAATSEEMLRGHSSTEIQRGPRGAGDAIHGGRGGCYSGDHIHFYGSRTSREVVDRARDGDAEERAAHGEPSAPGVLRQGKDGLGPRMARSDRPLRGSDVLDATSRGGHAEGSGRFGEVLGPVPGRAERHHSVNQRNPLKAESYHLGYVT